MPEELEIIKQAKTEKKNLQKNSIYFYKKQIRIFLKKMASKQEFAAV
jgi:hypothetical protein